ncbi:MAG TPA: DNA polymerase IV [Steroidobacteraceae bacterium]|nr:DNA polymerase IV [Steroidobacteraceae bacterium]
MQARSILHVDMDAFYASVEALDRPELAGLPLIVGQAGPRGVVAAASYAVRRFGVRSAMPIGAALRLCPQAIIVPPRMARYREISAQALAIFESLTPLVEPLSLDEAFLDVTASRRLHGEALTIAERIRRRVRSELGLTASVGVAPNKLVAKIASDLRKPDGLCRIGAEELPQALDELPVERLWGIGAKSLPRVQAAGMRCFRDLRVATDSTLRALFGRQADTMRRRAAGIDERPVVPQREEQSISAECTFETDLSDPPALRSQLSRLVDRVAARLRASGSSTAQVAIKVRTADFATITRQRSFEPPTHDTAPLWRLADGLLADWLVEHPRAAVRLLGVAVADLAAQAQPDLFGAGAAQESRIDAAVDEVRRRFGSARLLRASQIRRRTD